MPFPYINEIKDLTDAVRAQAGGSFIRLTDGICHYELHPPLPKSGEGLGMMAPVVLVHGFSVPGFIWDPTFDFLAKSGFRVLRFDLFGRGLSDRPRIRYGIALYVRQLHDLLEALRITEPIHLCGLSMGGPISAAFAVQYPERVRSHILIDPAGGRAANASRMLKLAQLPLLPELILGLASNQGLLKSIASDFYDPALVEHFIEKFMPQMDIKGFKRALLSSIRNGMLDSFYETYQRVGKLGKPTLLVWGRNDTTLPFEQSEAIRSAIPHAGFRVIENAGHIPHYENPGEVNPLLRQFLNSL